MLKYINGEEIAMTPEEVAAWKAVQSAYVPPEPPAKTKLFKSTLIRRMSLSEAAYFEGILAAEEPWVRMLYNASEWFEVSDALVQYMHMVLSEGLGAMLGDPPGGPYALGIAKADMLLAPEI